MKLSRILYLLLAVTLITPSCMHTNKQLQQAEQLIESAPDSAMAILKKFDYNKLSDNDKALYGLLYVRISDKNSTEIKSDSFLNFSTMYYLKHPDNELLGACYLFRARQFFNDMQFEIAMKYYLMALDQHITNFELKGKLYADVGKISMQQRDYNVARSKFFLAFENFKQGNLIRPAYNVLISVGRTYTFEHKYDSARLYYSRALSETNDAFVVGNALQESGIAYYYQHNYDSAKYYFKKSIHFPYIKNNLAIRYYYLSEVCFELYETLNAQNYALKSIKSDADIRTQRECYRILANCASRLNIQNDIGKYMLYYQNCSDSIRKIDSQTKGSYIETMHNTQNEAAKSRSWIWYLSAFVLLIIITSTLIYVRKHKKSVLEMKMAEEKQLKQKVELRQEVVLKSRLAVETTIKELRNEMMANHRNINPDLRRKLLNKLYGDVIHFNDKTHFKKEMDTVMNNLYSKLESRYPELTQKDIQWACLYELKVSHDDIMDLLDFNIESYKKMRQRFAKKIAVQYIKSIDVLLENILTE